jgi:hypothetical protein
MRAATTAPMNADRFWSIIAATGGPRADADVQETLLRAQLEALTVDELVAFEVAYRHSLNAAYTWELWGAAYVVNGGCSDDGFEYFRRWLVARGREAYETGVRDPDALARMELAPGPDGAWEHEGIYYIAREVFQAKGGQGDVRAHSEPEAGLGGPAPTGTEFDENDLPQKYPKLWARFGENPLG